MNKLEVNAFFADSQPPYTHTHTYVHTPFTLNHTPKISPIHPFLQTLDKNVNKSKQKVGKATRNDCAQNPNRENRRETNRTKEERGEAKKRETEAAKSALSKENLKKYSPRHKKAYY